MTLSTCELPVLGGAVVVDAFVVDGLEDAAGTSTVPPGTICVGVGPVVLSKVWFVVWCCAFCSCSSALLAGAAPVFVAGAAVSVGPLGLVFAVGADEFSGPP